MVIKNNSQLLQQNIWTYLSRHRRDQQRLTQGGVVILTMLITIILVARETVISLLDKDKSNTTIKITITITQESYWYLQVITTTTITKCTHHQMASRTKLYSRKIIIIIWILTDNIKRQQQ